MISILVSWSIILFTSLIMGKGIIIGSHKLLKIENTTLQTWDVYVVTGLVFLNVYAQYFSLIYKVAAIAWLPLLILITLAMCLLIKNNQIKYVHVFRITRPIILIIICILIITGLIWTIDAPSFGDAYLYHAQAIRWIEEYGVVPGLGNLHNRFAYNSAFMALQALFSFKWLCGQSLHSLNGFVSVFFAVYAVYSLDIAKRKSVSNWIKIIMFLYIFMNRNYFSSPTSDMLALLLLLWINAKWTEQIENGQKSIVPYVYLVIISVYAATVKLSVAAGVLLAIFPLIYLIKRKRWLYISVITFICIGVAFPFLARNIIVSGYLLYPYSTLDIFNVDWKMLSSVAEFDSMTITVWGRGVKDVSRYSESIVDWFPVWFNNDGIFYQVTFIVGMVSMVGSIIYMLRNFTKREKSALNVLILSNVAGFMMWFLGAPLIRYGIVFLWIFPCFLLGLFSWDKRVFMGYCYVFLPLYISMCLLTYKDWNKVTLIWQQDYEKRESHVVDWNGISIYIPDGDDIGYHAFPSTPHDNQLNIIEMRSENISDGFRINERYADKHINSDGIVW